MKLKIAIGVHGRFHAFDLARALLERGHDVTLLTNYPKWAVERFGVPRRVVRSFWLHGILSRTLWHLSRKKFFPYSEDWLHPMFGKWACVQIRKESWDVVHLWSGVSEEILQWSAGRIPLRILMRGSSHIRTQARLLQEEEARVGVRLDKPSQWILAREEREYELAGRIVTLSTFSKQTFLENFFPEQKLCLLVSGTNTRAFKPRSNTVEDRYDRILAGEPLRVLTVGAFSFRKGIWDLAEIARALAGEGFQFRFVGAIAPEAASLAKKMRQEITFVPKRPQHRLPEEYAWGDVFVFPTIEDGFPSVLAQAAASGLPILTTPNGAGADLVSHNETGWVLPIRTPSDFIERLRWCDENRSALARMARRMAVEFRPRDWSDVAADFEKLCTGHLSRNTIETTSHAG